MKKGDLVRYGFMNSVGTGIVLKQAMPDARSCPSPECYQIMTDDGRIIILNVAFMETVSKDV